MVCFVIGGFGYNFCYLFLAGETLYECWDHNYVIFIVAWVSHVPLQVFDDNIALR